jgi:hypothetical protein
VSPRSSRILVFAIAFAVFIILPAFLNQPFPAYPLMHVADTFDLLTPFVLITAYWLLFVDAAGPPDRRWTIAFLLLATLWVSGQAMHLAANSINNLLGEGSSDVHNLVHFYDEVLSHYLWHAGILGLSVLLVASESMVAPADVRGWSLGVAAVLYGLTFFLAVNEGGTVPLGLPGAAAVSLWLLARGRPARSGRPLAVFFLGAYLLALVLLAGWGLYWKGFPEFTDVGLL